MLGAAWCGLVGFVTVVDGNLDYLPCGEAVTFCHGQLSFGWSGPDGYDLSGQEGS